MRFSGAQMKRILSEYVVSDARGGELFDLVGLQCYPWQVMTVIDGMNWISATCRLLIPKAFRPTFRAKKKKKKH